VIRKQPVPVERQGAAKIDRVGASGRQHEDGSLELCVEDQPAEAGRRAIAGSEAYAD
jgi:hypothetical protein